jgi:hypothetical protein
MDQSFKIIIFVILFIINISIYFLFIAPRILPKYKNKMKKNGSDYVESKAYVGAHVLGIFIIYLISLIMYKTFNYLFHLLSN